MEPEETREKVNEDFIEFIRNRNDAEAPRYTARLKTYVDILKKRSRAHAARLNRDKRRSELKRRTEAENKDKPNDIENQQPDDENGGVTGRRSRSRCQSEDPEDACCRRRRRRRRRSSCRRRRRRRRSGCRRRRRRRSRRRRRRRRSCSRRRRRRRSCSRRRRRRSACRRRRRRRRRRCGC